MNSEKTIYDLYVIDNITINKKSYFIVFGNHYYSVHISYEGKRIYGLMSGAKLYNITSLDGVEKIYDRFKYIIPIKTSTNSIDGIFNYNCSLIIEYNDAEHFGEIINSLNESGINFKYKTHPLDKAHFHIFESDKDKLRSIFILLGANIAREYNIQS